MARGTKPTVAQANVMRSKGIDPNEWLFVKTEVTTDGSKRLSKFSQQYRSMVIKHRSTGEVRRLDI